MSTETASKKSATLSRDQIRTAQKHIDNGFSSQIIAIHVGARTRQIGRVRVDETGRRGTPKQDNALFRTKNGQTECATFLSVYRNIVRDRVGDLPVTEDVDINAVAAAHHYLRHLMPSMFFEFLDINSAYALVERYIAGSISFERCKKRFCRANYVVPEAYGYVTECPICSIYSPNFETRADEDSAIAFVSTEYEEELSDDEPSEDDTDERLIEAFNYEEDD